jgi:hypothetical protein
MFNQICCGGVAALLITCPVSALTMTPTSDFRQTNASAMAGEVSDSQSDFPNPDFSIFVSESSATANEFPVDELVQDAGFIGFGATASANARQNSQFGPLSISGSGSANADGNQGEVPPAVVDGGTLGGRFSANAGSLLDVFFSIDESAAFDLQGFLSAGIQLATLGLSDGGNGGVNNSANILLINVDTNATAYEASISNDSLSVNESGVLSAGNYRFSVGANASVDDQGVIIKQSDRGLDGYPGYPYFGYSTAANFEASLQLSAIDKPIPEPVTTTLTALGLGALALQTTRRRYRA